MARLKHFCPRGKTGKEPETRGPSCAWVSPAAGSLVGAPCPQLPRWGVVEQPKESTGLKTSAYFSTTK